MPKSNVKDTKHLHPGLFRRLAAMAYDAILLAAVLMICFIPVPLLSESFRNSLAGKLSLQLYIALILFVFFGWFWTHQGQTLGMRAWRLKVVRHDGNPISWGDCAKRFMLATISFAMFGIGYLLCLIQSNNMTFHDLFSGTKLVMLEKKNKKSGNSP